MEDSLKKTEVELALLTEIDRLLSEVEYVMLFIDVLKLVINPLKGKFRFWGSHLDSILECLFLYILLYNIS